MSSYVIRHTYYAIRFRTAGDTEYYASLASHPFPCYTYDMNNKYADLLKSDVARLIIAIIVAILAFLGVAFMTTNNNVETNTKVNTSDLGY